jgi:hypothetical protein
MIIGGILAGLLLLVIVGIARGAGGVDVAGSIQNNAGAIVARPVLPQAQPVALPVVQVVVVTATPTRPTHNWLDIAVDVTGGWWVWGDSAWIACGRIAADLTYNVEQREPSYRNWYWLHANQRLAVYNRCLEVTR